jgi:hypothetical protein
MDKYKDAFGNLKVPEDMARRVTEKLAQEPENVVPISAAKKKKRPWVTVAACAACLALILGAWSISKPNGQLPAVTAPVETDDSGVQTANPMQDVSSPDEFSEYLGFEPEIPADIPAGYAVSSCTAIDGRLAQIVYSNGQTEVTFRTARGGGDVSGDYNAYPENDAEGVYTLCGAEGSVTLVKWTSGGCAFSLSFSPAVSRDAALQWAEGTA